MKVPVTKEDAFHVKIKVEEYTAATHGLSTHLRLTDLQHMKDDII